MHDDTREGDLPRRVGGPATRALTAAGVTTLAQVADLSDDQLTALHGVGPKAVRVLREALERRQQLGRGQQEER